MEGGVVALGKFEGLHLGHRALAERASELGTPVMLSLSGMAEVLGWEPQVCTSVHLIFEFLVLMGVCLAYLWRKPVCALWMLRTRRAPCLYFLLQWLMDFKKHHYI